MDLLFSRTDLIAPLINSKISSKVETSVALDLHSIVKRLLAMSSVFVEEERLLETETTLL